MATSTGGSRARTLPSTLHGDAHSTIPRRNASATSLCQTTLSPLEPSHTTTLLMGNRKQLINPSLQHRTSYRRTSWVTRFRLALLWTAQQNYVIPHTHTHTLHLPPSLTETPVLNAANGKQYRYLLIYVRPTAEKLNHQSGLKVEITCRLRRMFW